MSESELPQADDHEAASAERVRRAIDDYEVPLTRYAMSLLRDLDRARDAVQDTFLKLYRQPPDGVAEAKVKSWLFTVCRNRSLDILKKEKRMISIDEQQIGNVRSAEPDPSQLSQAAEDRQEMAAHVEEVLRHMDGLPAKQREVLRLKFQGGMSYKEIAGTLGLSVSNVGFLLHTGLKRLRKSLAVANN